MKTLLLAGFLYLVGVAVVLLGKPDLMFQENGDWKEFGIGRDPQKNTWMPVWLFMVLWAVMSYIVSLVFVQVFMSDVGETNFYSENVSPNVPVVLRNNGKAGRRKTGYYVLNNSGDMEDGVAQYIYLGKALPMDGGSD